ncbi:MAG TPA: hypothetical protein VE753_08680 [Gaiellaceae bacterium]|nr:hypothetical protein [Gaiellales bacterium]HYX89429.1 hypothetical protein [Gaiellaceae bacterium]
MDERSGSVRLVESRPDAEARGLVATVPRGEVEKALRADAPVDLLLDVERVADDGEGREIQRLALAWEPQDLERLLTTTSGEEVSLTFDEEELRRLLDEDVEAHGMREKLAVLSVVAGIAAAGAGSAAAAVAPDGGGSATASTPAASQVVASEVSTGLTGVSTDPATASEISTGLGTPEATPAAAPATPSEVSTGITQEPAVAPATPSEVSTGITPEPAVTPAEVTTGITAQPTATPVSASQPSSDWAPSPEMIALAAGMILGLTALGFAVRTHRRTPATP